MFRPRFVTTLTLFALTSCSPSTTIANTLASAIPSPANPIASAPATPSGVPSITLPSNSPTATSSPTAGRTWTDAEIDALLACFAASKNQAVQFAAATQKSQLDVLRGAKASLKPGDYDSKLSAFGNLLASMDSTFKSGCVK